MIRALWFLVETLASLLATACLLRALAWRLQLSARNPISQFLIAVTDWLVKPLRRALPASRTTDWGSLVAALLISVVLALAWTLVFARGRPPAFGGVLLLAGFWLVKWSMYMLMGLVILHAVLSWVNPHAPVAPVLDQLTRPFLAPLRRVIPLVGGVDLSPLVVIILAQVALTGIESLFLSLVAVI
ncbi:MAG: YggT family protein [Burkholderiaceae bacterium]|nr:YggT family protein [Burkholderiaceae bacterium]